MNVHFSIDDVIKPFEWAYKNNPNSIFDMDFFGILKSWHRNYGLKVSLYAFGSNQTGFSMEMLPEKYCMELRENASWLSWAILYRK